MKKNYEPGEIEKRWYHTWEESGDFAPQGDGDPYCIMLPPPNVTGTLHMGHAFQDTLMDCLIRYHRMRHHKTLWQPGTDHAGIATQMVIERQLEISGTNRKELGREKFIQKAWEWKKLSGKTITQQLRRMGTSLDWSRECFTLDKDLSAAVTKAFIDLYDKKLIYRGKRLTNWDPELKTAISDLEVLSEEETGHLWHIRYPLNDSENELIVATTRPETMFGDAAVAVHPEDSRYQDLIGKTICLPLSNRNIPVIADTYVDPEFGSGCVKITPAHDFNDYVVGQRHQLPQINILEPDASLKTDDQFIPEKYQTLDRYSARKSIVADLEKNGFLVKVEEHKMMIPRGDRSGSVIEPYLTDQWFLKTENLADTAKKAVRDGKIRFTPAKWEKTYFDWMDNIEDWCISRQLWWGHRIPAWYDHEGHYYVAESENEVRKKYQLPDDLPLSQDEDVLDTWFSSALWPLSTLGWPKNTPQLQCFYPTSVLVTGFDIIFFWVARMIMMGLEFTGDVPFREVYIHGLVRDADGKKMSKSKGNVLDPIDLIDGITLADLLEKRTSALMQPDMAEKIKKKTRQQFPDGIAAYGTDALRFTFIAMASNNRDIRFDLKRIEGYRNFCNKLWNASRFITLICDEKTQQLPQHTPRLIIDRWMNILSRDMVDKVNHYITTYRFDLMANTLHEFVWHHYCDWYLEFSKIIQNSDLDPVLKAENRACLLNTLEMILRTLHPIIPFITEELWQSIKPLTRTDQKTIQYCTYPQTNKYEPTSQAEDEVILTEIQWLKNWIMAIRRIRSEINISPAKQVPLLVQNWTPQDRRFFDQHELTIMRLAKLEHVKWIDKNEEPQAAIALVGQTRLLIALSGLVDVTVEIDRLNKEISKLEQNLIKLDKRLNDNNFIRKAPEEIITQQRKKREDIYTALQQLKEQIKYLDAA